MKRETFKVYAMTCGSCGFTASAMTEEGKLVAMMMHLLHTHAGKDS